MFHSQKVFINASRFTKSQIVSILKQTDAWVTVKDIYRQACISVPTYYH